jgi:hypothetical protein
LFDFSLLVLDLGREVVVEGVPEKVHRIPPCRTDPRQSEGVRKKEKDEPKGQ